MTDGSDSVRDPKNAPPRLALGAPGFKFMVNLERTRAAMAATLERIEHVVTRP